MSFSYPPHLTILAWVVSDFFFWLATKCLHAVPKCEQLSYQYIWPTLATYNKSCEWCEVKKTNFPTRPPWTVFRPIIADGKPSCPWLYTMLPTELLNREIRSLFIKCQSSHFASCRYNMERQIGLWCWFSDIRKLFFDIRKSISDIRKCLSFWYQKIIFWYQKLFADIRKCHDFLISEIICWY